MDPEYRLLAAIVVTAWVVAIGLAIMVSIEPDWAHFGM